MSHFDTNRAGATLLRVSLARIHRAQRIIDAQLDLFGDYENNINLYGVMQALFRERQYPTLIAWGERDVFFTKEGARAYLRDLPRAHLHFLDTGHFALETHCSQIGSVIRGFLPSLTTSG
jgi:pimeloyl-ACP methyl ester carboxylesterase